MSHTEKLHYLQRSTVPLPSSEILKRMGAQILNLGSGSNSRVERIFLSLAQTEDWPLPLIASIDISPHVIQRAKALLADPKTTHPHISLYEADAIHLPFPDNTFTGIIATGLLEQITNKNDRRQCVREICRVGRHRAQVFISDTAYNPDDISRYLEGYSQTGELGSFCPTLGRIVHHFTAEELKKLLAPHINIQGVQIIQIETPVSNRLVPALTTFGYKPLVPIPIETFTLAPHLVATFQLDKRNS